MFRNSVGFPLINEIVQSELRAGYFSQSLQSRACSATSNGLDSNQIHFLFNKRGSRSSITTSSSHENMELIALIPLVDITHNCATCKIKHGGEVVLNDTVFVGSQDSVANMNLLCRLNIEFVCDLCNEDGEEVNRRRYDCPCLCPRRSQHFRYFVAMDVPETEKKCIDSKINMTVLFDQFCDLVERGRKAGKSVLVCSAKGRNRAPAFCAAYLISKERMTRQQAVAKVLEQHIMFQMSSMRPAPNISDFMQRALMRYQSSKGIQGAHSIAHTIPLFSIKRTAWT
ncbi:dual specificity phosphatase, catalytic domain protein [Ostertagia ostertagi]